MHKHGFADTVVEGHPLLKGLAPFLKKEGVTEDTVDFLKSRISFLYPKTVWIKLVAYDPEDVKKRSDFDSEKIGFSLNKWFIRKREFHTFVCDLSDVTIVSTQWINGFINSVKKGFRSHFLLCRPELTKLMDGKNVLEDPYIFTNRETLINFIRSSEELSECIISFPEKLSLDSLEENLVRNASDSKLCANDIAVFDLRKTNTIDFDGISMIPAAIHSMAHQHGIMGKVLNPRHKSLKAIKKYDVFRVINSYLLEGDFEQSEDIRAQAEVGLRMTAFTHKELFALKDLCTARFRSMANTYRDWFFNVAGLTPRSRTTTINARGDIIRLFREMINELLDNVAIHADGLGYLMFDLDPETGLRFYIGDTGIGLTKGLKRAYKKTNFDDVQAVSRALSLIEMKDRRRSLIGYGSTGGRGLERVGIILEDLNGYLTIRTGKAGASFAPGRSRSPQEVKSKLYDIQGTHIHIFIPSRNAA